MEFKKVIELVKSFALTRIGRKVLDNLRPKQDCYSELSLVEEMIRITSSGYEVFPENIASVDIEEILEKAQNTLILDPKELLKCCDGITAANAVKLKIVQVKESDLIKRLAGKIESLEDVVMNIRRCISEDGLVKDEASEELGRIRNEIKHMTQLMRKKVESFITSNKAILQDNIFVVRDGRYVFPIRASHKNQVKGIVHASSGSAATYFIEPEEFVVLNNQLRLLREEEEIEVKKILRNLTSMILQKIDSIKKSLEIVAQIDSLRARALFANKYNATVIYPSTSRIIKLMKARHPLLNPQIVVPVDIILPKDKQGLVLTGPNMGGKTVSLKTVGLFCVMMMAGFPLPCSPDSELFGFSKIVVDIGDEQSIEQNLSTFSSHLSNIVLALEIADENTLVLFDELGSGTDPLEGAALALALIEKLKELKAKFIVTTHLTPIKVYAANDPELVSASVEFDPETLSPTYRILLGVPGASHAFEIARKLGLDETVLQRAQQLLGKDYLDMEKVLRDYQEQVTILAKRTEELEKEKETIEKMRLDYEKKYRDLKSKRIEELDDELRKTYEYIREMKRQIDEAISNLKQKNDNVESLRSASKVLEKQTRMLKDLEIPNELANSQEINVGDYVRLKNGDAIGRVVEMRGGKLVIDFKGIRLETYPGSVVKTFIKDSEEKQVQPVFTELVKPEIDIRGLTVEEAEPIVEDFIDKLVRSNFKTGSIIHGKGTGRLAVGIWEILRSDSRVKKYRFGTPAEGGTGVTVVEV